MRDSRDSESRDDVGAPIDVEVLAPGDHVDASGRKVSVTVADIDQLVANGALLRDYVKPAVKITHDEANNAPFVRELAFGWVQGLRNVGGKLVATLTDVPQFLRDLIKAGRLRRTSAEFIPDWGRANAEATLRTGVRGPVFSGLALLGITAPAIKNLADLPRILASEGPFKLQTEETVVCLHERQDPLSAEWRAQVDEVSRGFDQLARMQEEARAEFFRQHPQFKHWQSMEVSMTANRTPLNGLERARQLGREGDSNDVRPDLENLQPYEKAAVLAWDYLAGTEKLLGTIGWPRLSREARRRAAALWEQQNPSVKITAEVRDLVVDNPPPDDHPSVYGTSHGRVHASERIHGVAERQQLNLAEPASYRRALTLAVYHGEDELISYHDRDLYGPYAREVVRLIREPDRRKFGAASARTSAEWELFARHPELTLATAPTEYLAFEAAKRETPLAFTDAQGRRDNMLLARHVLAARPDLDRDRQLRERLEAEHPKPAPVVLAEPKPGEDPWAWWHEAIEAECRERGIPRPVGGSADKPEDMVRYREVVQYVAVKHGAKIAALDRAARQRPAAA